METKLALRVANKNLSAGTNGSQGISASSRIWDVTGMERQAGNIYSNAAWIIEASSSVVNGLRKKRKLGSISNFLLMKTSL